MRKHKTGIALFAKKYARKFKTDLEILDSYLQEIKNLTSNYKSNQELLSIIRENLEKVSTTRNTISKQNMRKNELEELLEKESSKLEELISKESEITSSSEYNEYVITKSKLDNQSTNSYNSFIKHTNLKSISYQSFLSFCLQNYTYGIWMRLCDGLRIAKHLNLSLIGLLVNQARYFIFKHILKKPNQVNE